MFYIYILSENNVILQNGFTTACRNGNKERDKHYATNLTPCAYEQRIWTTVFLKHQWYKSQVCRSEHRHYEYHAILDFLENKHEITFIKWWQYWLKTQWKSILPPIWWTKLCIHWQVRNRFYHCVLNTEHKTFFFLIWYIFMFILSKKDVCFLSIILYTLPMYKLWAQIIIFRCDAYWGKPTRHCVWHYTLSISMPLNQLFCVYL